MNVEVRQDAGGNYQIGAVIAGHWVPFHSLDPQTVQMVGVPEEQASKEVKTPDETLEGQAAPGEPAPAQSSAPAAPETPAEPAAPAQ